MAQTIFNTSRVIDNSTEPPVVVTSNQVQTIIRQPFPQQPAPIQCIKVFICPQLCCCRQNGYTCHLNNCNSNFPEDWFDNKRDCCNQDRDWRASHCRCERKDNFFCNNQRNNRCF